MTDINTVREMEDLRDFYTKIKDNSISDLLILNEVERLTEMKYKKLVLLSHDFKVNFLFPEKNKRHNEVKSYEIENAIRKLTELGLKVPTYEVAIRASTGNENDVVAKEDRIDYEQLIYPDDFYYCKKFIKRLDNWIYEAETLENEKRTIAQQSNNDLTNHHIIIKETFEFLEYFEDLKDYSISNSTFTLHDKIIDPDLQKQGIFNSYEIDENGNAFQISYSPKGGVEKEQINLWIERFFEREKRLHSGLAEIDFLTKQLEYLNSLSKTIQSDYYYFIQNIKRAFEERQLNINQHSSKNQATATKQLPMKSKLDFTKDKLKPIILELANLNGYAKPSDYLDELLKDVDNFDDYNFRCNFFLDIHYLCKENASLFWSEGHRKDITSWFRKARIVTDVFNTTWESRTPKQEDVKVAPKKDELSKESNIGNTRTKKPVKTRAEKQSILGVDSEINRLFPSFLESAAGKKIVSTFADYLIKESKHEYFKHKELTAESLQATKKKIESRIRTIKTIVSQLSKMGE